MLKKILIRNSSSNNLFKGSKFVVVELEQISRKLTEEPIQNIFFKLFYIMNPLKKSSNGTFCVPTRILSRTTNGTHITG